MKVPIDACAAIDLDESAEVGVEESLSGGQPADPSASHDPSSNPSVVSPAQALLARRYGEGGFAGFANIASDNAAAHDNAIRQLSAKYIDRDGRFRG